MFRIAPCAIAEIQLERIKLVQTDEFQFLTWDVTLYY